MQWLIHGSWDWFWQYAGITALGAYLLGVAAAPGLGEAPPSPATRVRAVTVAGLVALALVAVPLFLSGRYLERANDEAQADPTAAIDDAGRAADLNPLSADPLITRGAIEAGLGRRAAAVKSFRGAAGREPDNYVPHLFIARELFDARPRAGLAALGRAEELNPRDPEIAALRREARRRQVSAGGG